MPRRKPKPEKVIQERIKENLDSILIDESRDSMIDMNFQDLPRVKISDMMNITDEQATAASVAKQLLDSIANFYTDLADDESSHVAWKKKVDAVNISAMMFQLKSAQHAITKILEEIDYGNTDVKLFAVLAQLQAQIMQMPKDYQSYMEKMEINYKKSRTEIDDKKAANASIITDGTQEYTSSHITSDGGIRSRGTRGIMEGLREIMGTEVIDIRAEVVDANALVNAKQKKVMDLSNPSNKNADFDENSSDYIVDSDLF
jgi:hypothetical protein